MTSSDVWPCAALPDASLASRTTARVGGSIEWLLEPATPEEFVEGFRAALERGYRPRVLGGGANLLIADGKHAGLVIGTGRLSRVFRPNRTEGMDWNDGSGTGASNAPSEAEELVAWAGAPIPGLVRAAKELGWSGLEGLVGIPGHVGGAVAMNAGGRWGDFWDVIQEIRVLTPDGQLEERLRADCQPSYRNGNLGEAFVLGAVVKLKREPKPAIQERMKQYLIEKSAAQPVTERSSGCIFKNPDPELSDGRSAGRLIDDCGGKGLSIGDAVVSPKHANFIVNRGSARAADFFGLILAVQRLVFEASGVMLEREVRVWNPSEDDQIPQMPPG